MIQLPKHPFTRTRIAPTPSGFLHLGNILSFVVTAGLARKYDARIFLRIDDLDRERVREAYVQDIFETLAYLGIPWDEGPRDMQEFQLTYSQAHRMPLYREALRHLEETGALFACSCSRSTLAATSVDGAYPGTCLVKNIPLDTPGVSWRLKTVDDERIQVHDLVKGRTEFTLPASMRHFVVRKKDGHPSYQLASVLDDIQFGVDLVVRGDDLFESTLAQVYLARHLPANPFGDTVFFHHPLLQDPQGRKLSKSEGDTAARYFREQGASPREVFAALSGALSLPGAASTWEELFVQLLDRWQIMPA